MGGARWIKTSDELTEAVAQVGEGPLALDCEADSLHRYRERLCLMQLSFGGRDLLVDPLAEADPRALTPWLADAGLRKILHGADYDLRLLDREYGLELRGVFDTMIAARLGGERAFGLAALLERHLDVKLDKRFQRADWAIRPLPPEMERYAMLDTRHLEELAARLEERLVATGRTSWAAEEFARLEGVRWTKPDPDQPRWLRVKGAARLDPRGLAVLRELYELRDGEARARDRPPFRVMRDEVLLQLSRDRPLDPSRLGGVAGLPASWRTGRRSARLLAAIGRGLDAPDDLLPRPPRSERRRTPPELEARVREMCRARDRVAGELDLEPSLIAPRAVIEAALGCIDAGGDLGELPDLRTWQREILEPLLRHGPG